MKINIEQLHEDLEKEIIAAGATKIEIEVSLATLCSVIYLAQYGMRTPNIDPKGATQAKKFILEIRDSLPKKLKAIRKAITLGMHNHTYHLDDTFFESDGS